MSSILWCLGQGAVTQTLSGHALPLEMGPRVSNTPLSSSQTSICGPAWGIHLPDICLLLVGVPGPVGSGHSAQEWETRTDNGKKVQSDHIECFYEQVCSKENARVDKALGGRGSGCPRGRRQWQWGSRVHLEAWAAGLVRGHSHAPMCCHREVHADLPPGMDPPSGLSPLSLGEAFCPVGRHDEGLTGSQPVSLASVWSLSHMEAG